MGRVQRTTQRRRARGRAVQRRLRPDQRRRAAARGAVDRAGGRQAVAGRSGPPEDLEASTRPSTTGWPWARARRATRCEEDAHATNSGHAVYLYEPALVASSIREVVEDVRAAARTRAGASTSAVAERCTSSAAARVDPRSCSCRACRSPVISGTARWASRRRCSHRWVTAPGSAPTTVPVPLGRRRPAGSAAPPGAPARVLLRCRGGPARAARRRR